MNSSFNIFNPFHFSTCTMYVVINIQQTLNMCKVSVKKKFTCNEMKYIHVGVMDLKLIMNLEELFQ